MNEIQRSDLVNWINQHLKPDTKLTDVRVKANPNFLGDHWAWHEVCYDQDDPHVDIDTDHQFAMIALAHSGRGCITFNDRYPLECLTDVMISEIGNVESDEFKASSYTANSFVVNGRLYQFEEVYIGSSDDRYCAEAAAEILNAVCIRQHLKGRFFVYTTEWYNELTLYLTPNEAKALSDSFGIKPDDGFEYYFDH